MQKSELELTSFDKTIEITSLIGIVLLWMLVVVNYSKLPNSIPIHFDISGKPNNFGEKSYVFLMPLVASVIFFFLTSKERLSRSSSNSESSRQRNASDRSTTSSRLYIYLKLMLIVFFSFLEIKTFQIATGKAESLGVWFIPLSIGILIAVIAYFKLKTFISN